MILGKVHNCVHSSVQRETQTRNISSGKRPSITYELGGGGEGERRSQTSLLNYFVAAFFLCAENSAANPDSQNVVEGHVALLRWEQSRGQMCMCAIVREFRFLFTACVFSPFLTISFRRLGYFSTDFIALLKMAFVCLLIRLLACRFISRDIFFYLFVADTKSFFHRFFFAGEELDEKCSRPRRVKNCFSSSRSMIHNHAGVSLRADQTRCKWYFRTHRPSEGKRPSTR